jgi:hypothetical protein
MHYGVMSDGTPDPEELRSGYRTIFIRQRLVASLRQPCPLLNKAVRPLWLS